MMMAKPSHRSNADSIPLGPTAVEYRVNCGFDILEDAWYSTNFEKRGCFDVFTKKKNRIPKTCYLHVQINYFLGEVMP